MRRPTVADKRAVQMPLKGTIRGMTFEDLDNVLAIERKSFIAPWSQRLFEETLRSTISRSVVLEEDGAMLGYMIFYMVDVEAHILNIAVDPTRRREGRAKMLVNWAIKLFKENDITECYLEVRESNRGAQQLYKKFGFTVIGRRRRYYTENGEDALVMQLLL